MTDEGRMREKHKPSRLGRQAQAVREARVMQTPAAEESRQVVRRLIKPWRAPKQPRVKRSRRGSGTGSVFWQTRMKAVARIRRPKQLRKFLASD